MKGSLRAELDQLKWDDSDHKKYIMGQMNACPRMTRDFAAISGGDRIPVHTYYEGVSSQVRSDLEKIENMLRSIRKSRRLHEISPKSAVVSPDPKAEFGAGQVFNVQGANARINIGSSDYSMNSTVKNVTVFSDLKKAVALEVKDPEERKNLEHSISDAEQSYKKGTFLEGYQKFISSAADHMKIIAPFIPELTKLLGS